jgi:alkenylglycerophosphocholine hydrolase
MSKSSSWTPFLVTLGLCGAAVFLTGLAVDNFAMRLVSKPLVCGAILAWTLVSRQDRFARLISLALGFCLVGDILLEFRTTLFLPGLVAYLVGHIMFIAAFLSDTRQPAVLRLIPIALWIATDFWIIYPGLGAMMIPVGIYVVVIGVMVWRAATRVGSHGETYWSEWSGLVGAFLFAFSDSLIALDRFYVPMESARYVIILTYWAALVLLASTILRKPDQIGVIR